MDWIEIIQLRGYTRQDKDRAVAVFGQLAFPVRTRGLRGIDLFGSLGLETDLGIFIRWRDGPADAGKSPLGLQLAAAFCEFGQIHHCGWAWAGNLKEEEWRHNHEHQQTG